MKKTKLFFIISQLFVTIIYAQSVATLQYKGGGDWYSNPTAIPNLIEFCNNNINTQIALKPQTVSPDSKEIFDYPILFMTGHGNVYFDEADTSNLRQYLISGGFLHISDNYGLNDFIRREMKKVFPDKEFLEIPLNHKIYKQHFVFKNGVPKIHEHDNKPAQAFGLFHNGRLICFYDYETDLSDGWENESIHGNTEETRKKALKMGANIIEYAFSN